MKKTIILVSAALAMATFVPVHGHQSATRARVTEEPDTAVVDSDMYVEDDDWAGTADADSMVADSADVDSDDAENFCGYNDELLADFSSKNANYNLQNSQDANAGISFDATLFVPGNDDKVEVKKGGGYSLMASRVLSAWIDSAAASKWEVAKLDKMLEAKWNAVKRSYTDDQNEVKKMAAQENFEYHPQSYSFRTTITPVWQWKDKGVTTYSIEDEAYTGGAHGMLYHYFLSMNEKADSVMGLTDIFKEEALPEVFKLVGEKLKTGPQAASDEDTWPSVAEVLPAPNANDYSVRSGQMQQYKGKWYPRPALTECGIVFTYPPYVKNCYAAGTIHIVINYAEAKDWLK